MKINRICAVCFSPTGKTREVINELAATLSIELKIPRDEYDFTTPDHRQKPVSYTEGDLVVFGVPVYAGRIPNKILPEIRRLFKGEGALAAAVVTFGNRSYDNALIELRNELGDLGFHVIAGGAFAAEHAFTDKLACGRPNQDDICQIRDFGKAIAKKVSELYDIPDPVAVPGTEPIPAYYQPLGIDGKPAVFLKAKPKISEACTGCRTCVGVCPLASIHYDEEGWQVKGICIKCQACIKACPVQAIYFDDPAFLSHVAMLEENYSRRAENEVFI